MNDLSTTLVKNVDHLCMFKFYKNKKKLIKIEKILNKIN